jgi:hypothetical protein
MFIGSYQFLLFLFHADSTYFQVMKLFPNLGFGFWNLEFDLGFTQRAQSFSAKILDIISSG